MVDRGLLASIVIDNYNYARFLPDAIESALAQTYRPIEVIVVDDGSDDESREVIAGYGDRVTAILKPNGGQASAFNAGFRASKGQVIFFLDSDDVYLPHAIASAMHCFEDSSVVKVHWPMMLSDEAGRPTGHLFPAGHLADGDVFAAAAKLGPTNHLSAPTSGNGWSRAFLASLFPLPEELYRNGCDTFLLEAAPFFGSIRAVAEPLSFYRQHAHNDHNSALPEERVLWELKLYDHYSGVLARRCRDLGVPISPDAWRANSWWHRHQQLIDELAQLPAGAVLLIDDACLESGPISGREIMRFPERDGVYWGPPASGAEAIAALEDSRDYGARFLVIAWPAFWWLDEYSEFGRYIRETFPRLVDDDVALIFDLRNRTTRGQFASARRIQRPR